LLEIFWKKKFLSWIPFFFEFFFLESFFF
jgi:hypothetical protein